MPDRGVHLSSGSGQWYYPKRGQRWDYRARVGGALTPDGAARAAFGKDASESERCHCGRDRLIGRSAPLRTIATALEIVAFAGTDSQLLLHLKREYSWAGERLREKRCWARATVGASVTAASRRHATAAAPRGGRRHAGSPPGHDGCWRAAATRRRTHPRIVIAIRSIYPSETAESNL